MQKTIDYIHQNKDRFVEELFDILRIPSISADSTYKNDVLKCANVVAEYLKKAGADNVEVCPTKGNPIVYGDKIISSELPTVLIYGHYDVQPPDPLELWNKPPFEPYIAKTDLHPEGAIFARGSADDKGQFFMHLKAFEAMMATDTLPCNVKFIIEGEEEIGSVSLGDFTKENKERLACDCILISDTSLYSMEQPTVTTGLRGLSYVEVEIEGDKFSIQQLLNNYKKDEYIILSDGTNALINREYIEKLQRIFKDEDENKVKISFFDMPIVQDILDEKTFNNEFAGNKDFFEGINKLSIENAEYPKLNATLRDYQKYGYKWLKYLTDNRLGACLADDMGLGKTLQAIALISKTHEEKKKRTMVIMPKSLIFNWESEIKKFAPNLKIAVYYGINRELSILKKADVVLTTYGTIRNDIENLLKEKFDKIGITLVDFKIEFGKNSKGEILLADEITPDTCRLWDKETGEKLDKDRFRRDLGNIEEAYIEVVKRLTEAK